MSVAVRVRAPSGTRDFDETELPLALGSGPDATLPLADPRLPGRAAFVGRRGGRFYLQAAPGVDEVRVDGAPLAGSARWLSPGDRIRIGGDGLTVEVADTMLVLAAEGMDAAATEPPVLLEEAETLPAVGGDTIQPVAFRRTLESLKEAGGRRRSPWRHLLWLPALLLAAIAWFVFTARPVHVVVEPVPESLDVEGRLLAPAFGDRFLLRPGRYTVRAQREEYEPLAAGFEVSGEGPDTVRFEMTRLPDLYRVTSVPEGAEVFVDGEPRGQTPMEALPLAPGRHRVVVDADRYLPWETEVEVPGGGQRAVLEAELVPSWGDVSIRSTPEGAQVSANGREIGATPLTASLEAGRYQLRVSRPGYKAWEGELSVRANEDLSLPEVVLEPADGRLRVSSDPPGASVLVDDRYRGQTPLVLDVVPDRAHRVELRKAGFESAERSIAVPSEAERSLALDLVPVLGEVQIAVTPADSTLRVAGETVVPENGRLRLPAVEQRLEVSREGYASRTVTVTPKPGVTQRVEVTLQTEAEARVAALQPRIRTSQGAELVLVGPGRFTMGSSRREPGRRANEGMREVEITRHYYIGVREVTNAEFRAFDPKHRSGEVGGYSLDDERHPVVRVRWEQAAAYANWLSGKEGLPPAYRSEGERFVPVGGPGYRLATEAEWAWAARYAGKPGAATRYAWGDALPPGKGAGNYADQAAEPVLGAVINNYEDGFPVTAPVASFSANALGLYDTGGNVSEWVQDYYGVGAAAGGLQTDPAGPSSGQYHVIRGASWMHYGITELRMSFRDYGDEPRPDVGIRLAKGVP